MGLFDSMFDPQDPTAAAKLSAAFGLLGGQNAGQAGLAGIQAAQRFRQQQDDKKRAEMQDQVMRMQMEGLQRAQAGEQAAQSYMTGALAEPDASMTPDMPGPRREPAGFNLGSALAAGVPLNTALQMAPAFARQQPKLQEIDPTKTYGVWDGGKFTPKVAATPVPEKDPEQIRTLKLIYGEGTPAYQAALQRLGAKATTHAPAANVSVNTGQKGFDNTLKLRGDFRGEPVYKAHQEMQSAHSQIVQALKQETPAGDLAGATKIMKLLDPGSVVRESELGMAMAASGLMDRVTNYGNMVLSGQKLTPQQRKDFRQLADALYSESVNQYNAKRGEYKGIVDRNQLNEADVLGPETRMPTAPLNVDDLVNKYRSK